MLVKFDSFFEAQEFIGREGAKIERYVEETDEACRIVSGLSSVLCKDSCGGLVHHIQIDYENGDTSFLDTSTVVAI